MQTPFLCVTLCCIIYDSAAGCVITSYTARFSGRKKSVLHKMCVLNFYLSTLHFDINEVHTPTNALLIKLDRALKFILKITLTCSNMFRSTTIIREPSLEPS